MAKEEDGKFGRILLTTTVESASELFETLNEINARLENSALDLNDVRVRGVVELYRAADGTHSLTIRH